jgi:hypothetical protein
VRLWTSGEGATVPFTWQTSPGGLVLMAIHLTPTELAREAGMERRDVIEKCMELGVPIFQGRIDKTLFLATMEDSGARQVAAA